MAWGAARVNSHKGLLFGYVVPFIQTTLTGGTDEGIPVKLTANKTVGKCSDGDTFHAFVASIGSGVCTGQLRGFIEIAYSGNQNPVVGREYLCADGAGKVRCGDTAAVGTITLSAVPEGRAQGTITISGGLPSADETITIDETVFTFKASASGAAEITIGADADACVTNIAAKINAHEDLIGLVTAAADTGADTVVVTAVAHTVATNSIVFTESATNLTMDGTGTLGGTRAGATNTFVIDTTTFTFVTARAAAGQVTVGSTVDATLVNIETAVNADMTTVVAAADPDTDTVAITAVTAGTAGNSIVFTESSNNLTIDGSGVLGGTTPGANGTAGREFLVTDVDTTNKVVTFFFKQ